MGSATTPLRFGLVGTGYWADEVHAVGIDACPDAELVGVWGRDPDKAARVAAAHGTASYASFDEFLDAVDAVAFAVPPQVQARLAVQAAGAGKHLLLEKPVATALASADELCSTVAGRNVASVVFFTERFVPELETWLEERSAAGPLGGRTSRLTCLDTPGNPFAGSPWRREHGALWDLGPHALAAVVPMLGPVTAVTGARGHGDLVTLVLSHDSGATSTVELSLTMPVDARRTEVEVYDEAGWHARPVAELDAQDAHRRAVAELIEQVRTGRRDHRCDVRFGRDVVAVIEQAEQVVGRREIASSASPDN